MPAPVLPIGAPVASSLATTHRAATTTLRERIEREEQARNTARERRQVVERRLERYHHNMAVTPSGRPFESLPLISMDDVRKLGRSNKRALATTVLADLAFMQ
eukprot:CAMPEP_0119315088 /NCGR_PEP_ID=MMETSP1333-20130426/34418_1 /TAXON_ID=418940 /ORGANISM="Scyphosphaera apsteinii, Strain RCC1455" /LENGTH=102 /DNA_ID=CAMNT_0007320323 /DNA_START=200 /DNA_END=508 /DNA_ORIENTATION=+